MAKILKIAPAEVEPPSAGGGEKSVVAFLIGPASKETRRFLQDICFSVSYKDYCTRLKYQVFERCRGLAFSDEFEDVTDEARQMALDTYRTLTEFRDLPEYAEMRETLRKAAEAYSYEGEGRDWVDKHMPIARRELIRALRDGTTDSQKLMVEMLERDVPKVSRNNDKLKTFHMTEEQAELMVKAIQQAGLAVPKELMEGSKPEKK